MFESDRQIGASEGDAPDLERSSRQARAYSDREPRPTAMLLSRSLHRSSRAEMQASVRLASSV